MKNTVRNSLTVLLLALFALVLSLPGKAHAAGVAINSTNFPDANFRSYVAGAYDLNENGYLEQSETNAVKMMNVAQEGISSLKGIGYFTSLEELYCYENDLTSLNLNQCTALQKLNCSYNDLDTLIISGCTNLVYVNATNNDLSSIDISKCTHLERFHCYNNLLKSLDLSKCPNIYEMDCSFNELTSLNLSGCHSLKSFYCNDNYLTSLDLSGNPDLEIAICENNNLNSLNVTLCSKLEDLTCHNNNLSLLNLYGCPKLYLAVSDGTNYEADGGMEWFYEVDDETYYRLLADVEVDFCNIPVKPVIKTQPKLKVVKEGTTAKFTVVAVGDGLKYLWQWRASSSDSWKNCTSATTGYNKATLQVSATTARNGYQYRCKVKNSESLAAYSNAATLYVLGIKTQPSSVSTTAGKTATFKITATGKSKTYQWQWRRNSSDSWTDCTSATTGYNTSTLQVSATTARNGYQYRCRVKDSAGNTVYSNAVTLKVLGLKTQPSSVSVKAGKTATFKVVATNAKTYQWQWRRNSSDSWTNCTSATTGYNTATLKVSATAARNGYQYRCQVKDAAGNTVNSKAATLTVK